MTKDCSFNMKNGKASWCAICETKNHAMTNCHLNLKINRTITQYTRLMQSYRTMNNEIMHKMTKIIIGTKVVSTNAGLTTNMEAMEVKVDSLGIETTDHVSPSNVSHVTRKDTVMHTVHTKT